MFSEAPGLINFNTVLEPNSLWCASNTIRVLPGCKKLEIRVFISKAAKRLGVIVVRVEVNQQSRQKKNANAGQADAVGLVFLRTRTT